MVTSLLQILVGAVIWQQFFTVLEVPLWKLIPEGEGYGTGVYNSAEDRLLQTLATYLGLPSSYYPVVTNPIHFIQICSSFMELMGLIDMKLKIINIIKKL